MDPQYMGNARWLPLLWAVFSVNMASPLTLAWGLTLGLHGCFCLGGCTLRLATDVSAQHASLFTFRNTV